MEYRLIKKNCFSKNNKKNYIKYKNGLLQWPLSVSCL